MTPSPPKGDMLGMPMMWWSARNPPVDPKTSFAGKIVLITGANVGLGYESAVKFASLNADGLILGVRSLERGEAAKARLCERTGYSPAKIRLYEIDQSSFASVEKCANIVSEMESRIDIAVLNAGGVHPRHTRTPNGYEFELQVMVLSTALLAILLLPKLRASAALSGHPSHLEFVGSSGHHAVKSSDFDLRSNVSILDQVNAESFFDAQRQYCVVKLFVMYIMTGLIKDMGYVTTKSNGIDPTTDVIVTTTCTGLCRTNLGREFGVVVKMFTHAYQYAFARSAEEGSRSIVSGAALGAEAMGEFWSHDVFFRKGELVTSEEGQQLQKRVWAEIKDVLRQHVPDLDQHLKQ